MSEIIITTDGTLANTQLKVDGKDITKNNKVVSIGMSAHAPYKGPVTGDIYRGGVGVSYEVMDEKGTIERKSIGSSDMDYIKGIGQKIKQQDQITQFIGTAVSAEVSTLIDKIIAHCSENKLPCPSKEALEIRTKESLLDKVIDLGIKLEG